MICMEKYLEGGGHAASPIEEVQTKKLREYVAYQYWKVQTNQANVTRILEGGIEGKSE